MLTRSGLGRAYRSQCYRSQLSEVKTIHSVSGQSNECDAVRVHRSTSALFSDFVCFLSLLLFCIHIGVRLAFVFLCCVSIVHHLLYSRRAPTQESRYLGETPMWMEILTSILWGCFVHVSMHQKVKLKFDFHCAPPLPARCSSRREM